MSALSATERTARSRARRAAELARLREALHRIALEARTLDAARKLATMALLMEPADDAEAYGVPRRDGLMHMHGTPDARGPQEAAGRADALPPVSDSPQAPEGPVAGS